MFIHMCMYREKSSCKCSERCILHDASRGERPLSTPLSLIRIDILTLYAGSLRSGRCTDLHFPAFTHDLPSLVR